MLDNADVFGGCRAAGVCIFLLSEAERFVFFLCNQLFVKEEVDLQVIIVDNVQFLCRDAVHRHGVDDGRHEVAHIGESVTAEESVCFLNDGAMADKDNYLRKMIPFTYDALNKLVLYANDETTGYFYQFL